MTDRERFVRTLTGRPVDRVPFIKVFGGTNAVLPHWEKEYPGLSSTIDELLGFEGAFRGWGATAVNMRLSQTGTPEVLEESNSRRVLKHKDGSVDIREKSGDYHHQTIEWPVKNRQDWERIREEHLQADDTTRFPADWPELVVEYRTRDYPLQLSHGGVYGFVRNLMGDERLLFTFYDDPDLVHEMMDTYTDMALHLWEKMVGEVDFDLIECWEDMASKNGAFISPTMFREFMTPNYQRIAAFASEHGIEIILVDSDGYIDDLAGLMLEAGVTAMYPFEVGAGCNVPVVRERYPDIGIIGGLNKQVMAYGKREIDAEVGKAREFIQMGRYVPGLDHFVLSDVPFENYRYFMERLREVVMANS
ncbi:MAG: hypothetical protein AUJ92_11515 [Armatimonadetes bacterium CG2_30_59_28]|nr:hypothetical protein [Armatimonadota bacterium]OIO93829.1 MAG: hypothetical protein AUJ92_11515 [Armatimonadetes bacterium CG2_30_59_28]